MRDYAKTIPDKTVINGISGALETTWVDPSPNFFRFNLDGAQWGTGLGSYVVNKKGWKRVATVVGRLFVRLHELPRLCGRLLQGRRRDRGAALGSARLRRFRRRDREAARQCRRHLPRRWRHGCHQLPQPVPAGRRQGQPDRRHDHGRPDRADLQGQGQGRPRRHADIGRRSPTTTRRRHGRPTSRPIRTAFPADKTASLAVAVRRRLLCRDAGHDRRH